MGTTGNNIKKEEVLLGHSELMTKEEILELYEKEDSMCITFSEKIKEGKLENIKGTGFFVNINNKDIPFNNGLITIIY